MLRRWLKIAPEAFALRCTVASHQRPRCRQSQAEWLAAHAPSGRAGFSPTQFRDEGVARDGKALGHDAPV
jgi:hypothetical protein